MLTKKTAIHCQSIRSFILSNHRRTIMVLVILATVFLPHSMQANDFQGCSECHEENLDKDSTRQYIHSSFMQQQCEGCHAPKAFTSQQKKFRNKDLSAGRNNQRKINWLTDGAIVDTNHGFLLSNDKLGDILVVEFHGTDDKPSQHEIAIPSMMDLAEVEDSGKPPTISKVQVLKVHRGIALTVTVGWQTDTLTDALVRYGINDFSQTSNPNKRLGQQHQVILSNLKSDKTYHFTAVSHDLFGRKEVSEPLTFSTSTPFTVKQPENPGNLHTSKDEVGISSRFQRFGTDYLLELTLEQPSSVFIGSKGVALGRNESHAGLSSNGVLSIKVCLGCHKKSNICRHPVKVKPKPGITVPPEYPTLPDGRITCISCHAPHSSDNQYLTRKPYRHELCVSCHLKWNKKR